MLSSVVVVTTVTVAASGDVSDVGSCVLCELVASVVSCVVETITDEFVVLANELSLFIVLSSVVVVSKLVDPFVDCDDDSVGAFVGCNANNFSSIKSLNANKLTGSFKSDVKQNEAIESLVVPLPSGFVAFSSVIP